MLQVLLVASSFFICFIAHVLLFQVLLKVLNERLLLMERVVIVLDECTWCKVKHEVLSDQVLLPKLELKQGLHQQVANSCIDKVLLLPLKLNESFFGWHVEVDQSLEELGSFHVLVEPFFGPQETVYFEELLKDGKVPISEVLELEYSAQFDPTVELRLIVEVIILIVMFLMIKLEVRYDLLVMHALPIRHLIEVLVRLHKELWEVMNGELLAQEVTLGQ